MEDLRDASDVDSGVEEVMEIVLRTVEGDITLIVSPHDNVHDKVAEALGQKSGLYLSLSPCLHE